MKGYRESLIAIWMQWLLSILLVLTALNLSFCQEHRYNYSTENVKKLKKVNEVNAGKIHIKTKINERGDIHVYLINRTDSLFRGFLGHSTNISFTKEAIDMDGNWKPIDYSEKSRVPKFICGTGMSYLKLDPDHYTWNKFYKAYFNGKYATRIRFSYRYKDSVTVISKPIDASIDYNLFLPLHKRQLKELDAALQGDTLSQKVRNRILGKKCRLYYEFESIEETIRVTHETLRENPDWVNGRFQFASYLIRYGFQNRKDIGDYQLSLILSKTISLLEQVPKGQNRLYELSREWIKKSSKFLLTKKDWLQQNKIHYEKIDDGYFAKYPLLAEEWIKIKFRSENLD